VDAHDAGQLNFFNTHAGLADNERSNASSPRCGASTGWSIHGEFDSAQFVFGHGLFLMTAVTG
jgi:hypothetical protein